MLRTDFGHWGGNVELFDVFLSMQEARRQNVAAGLHPDSTPDNPMVLEGALLEAATAGDINRVLETDGRGDFASYLWEPMAASFYAAYDLVAGQFARYTGKKPLKSFDIHRIKGKNGLQGMAYVGENGEYTGLRRSFRPETGIAADTYGATYSLTRQLLRSSGIEEVLRDLPGDLGDAAADFFTQMIVSFIVSNPNAPDGVAMYHASRGNLVTTALSEDTLIDAATWLGTRKDPDNRPIRVKLDSAVVQNERQAARLRQALNSQELLQTGVSTTAMPTTTFGRGNMNPLPQVAGLMDASGIVVDPYIPDAEDIYYFADPKKMPAFVVGYLDGQEKPFIGKADTTVMHLSNSNGSGYDPYTYQGDSIDYKIRHDLGLQALEPLATYKQAPA